MNSPRLAFRSLAVSLLLLASAFVPNVNAQSSSDWVEEILGTYQSQIWSAGSLASGITEFRTTSDGSLEGSYTINEQGKPALGKLSQCQTTEALAMRCVWNDKYGTGTLDITFAENFSSFNGYWAEGGAEPVFRWSGSR